MENICPKCGHELNTTSFGETLTFCPYCGSKVSMNNTVTDYGFCPFCGGKRTDSSDRCKLCGKSFSNSNSINDDFPPLNPVSEASVISNGYAGGIYNGNGDTLTKKVNTQPTTNNTTNKEAYSSDPNEPISPMHPGSATVKSSTTSSPAQTFGAVFNPVKTSNQTSASPVSAYSNADVFSAINKTYHSSGDYDYPSNSYGMTGHYSSSNNYYEDYSADDNYDTYRPAKNKHNSSYDKNIQRLQKQWAAETNSYHGNMRRDDDYRNYSRRSNSSLKSGPDGVTIFLLIMIILIFLIGSGLLIWYYNGGTF